MAPTGGFLESVFELRYEISGSKGKGLSEFGLLLKSPYFGKQQDYYSPDWSFPMKTGIQVYPCLYGRPPMRALRIASSQCCLT